MGIKKVNFSVSASLNKVFTSQEEFQSLFLTLIKLSRKMFECYRSFKTFTGAKDFPFHIFVNAAIILYFVFHHSDDANE